MSVNHSHASNNFLPSLHYSSSQKGFRLDYGRVFSGTSRSRPMSTYEDKILRSALIKTAEETTTSLDGVRVFSNRFMNSGSLVEKNHNNSSNLLMAKPVSLTTKSHVNKESKSTMIYTNHKPKLVRKKSSQTTLAANLNANNNAADRADAISLLNMNIAKPTQTKQKSKTNESHAKAITVYLSQKQSPVISSPSGRPAAPPGTPSIETMRRVKYVPSMSDNLAKQQIKTKLKLMKKVEEEKEKVHKAERLRSEAKEQKERDQELKKQQRRMIYLLNNAMTKVEHEHFKKFKKLNTLKEKVYPQPNIKSAK